MKLFCILSGIFLFSGVFSGFLNAEQSMPLEITVTPTIDIPIGPGLDIYGGKPPYSIGYGAGIRGDYILPFSNFIFSRASLNYTMLPVPNGEVINTPDISLVTIGAGAGLKFSFFDKLQIKTGIQGGYYIGIIENESGGNIFWKIDMEGAYNLSSALNIGLGTSYRYFALPAVQDRTIPDRFYDGIQLYLGVTYNTGAGSGRAKIDIKDIRINQLFPVLYKYYDTNPLGLITLKNNESGTIKNIKVTFFVKQYMDKPKLCAQIAELRRGEEKQVQLFALFTDDILNVTEGNTVNAELKAEYQYLGDNQHTERNRSVKVLYRNAITWDDDRKAAAFITAKDPVVLRLAKNAVGEIRHQEPKPINENFRKAVSLFTALGLYGMSYIIDPNSSYAELSGNKYSLDYLQFPAESLSYKAGDCDDLAVLYTALLEAVGVSTALITAPGHIFTAVDLNIEPEKAGRIFSSNKNLIFRNGKTWVPVETTMVGMDFIKAWEEGAKQWRANTPGKAAFYPVHDAWKNYPPIGNPGKFGELKHPSSDKLVQSYIEQIDKFIRKEIGIRVSELKNRIRVNNNRVNNINRLGVLYARFGMYRKAREQFERIAKNGEHLPAVVNLGNIFFLKGDFDKALTYYKLAQKKDGSNLSVLLGLARTYYELEVYDKAFSTFRTVRNRNPGIAEQFSYLAEAGSATTRSASAAVQEITQWEE
ncbi:MAG: tetratricopeptide repeat protein [Spirochaetes bacterium]|nr:tetratricopeptide repeat protein [Spirochaetota bacterium]